MTRIEIFSKFIKQLDTLQKLEKGWFPGRPNSTVPTEDAYLSAPSFIAAVLLADRTNNYDQFQFSAVADNELQLDVGNSDKRYAEVNFRSDGSTEAKYVVDGELRDLGRGFPECLETVLSYLSDCQCVEVLHGD